ncbi:right-handed parallel beta-helix repeat-containing protein [Streptomyces sp. NPDC015220]|uniref:right-handed parallel beta-helix repeat-containing protein n=1 Tax=Streptomyces sp. NPDC015220 TaxID=3364947 RepID=UPI0036FC9880
MEAVTGRQWHHILMGLGATALLLAGVSTSVPRVSVSGARQEGRTFYLSPEGDDDADGRTPQTAWRTLRRADTVRLEPGDHLLLKGGARFSGTLTIGQDDAGNARMPVLVESYGEGRAVIAAAGTHGIKVNNTSGIVIRNLILAGDTTSYRSQDGIAFISDLPRKHRLPYVRVTGVDVSGFRNGIRLHSGAEASGFQDVVINDCAVHDNKDAGLISDGPPFNAGAPAYAHEDVTVSKVVAFRNDGDPQASDRNTGSGIVLGSVHRGVVRGSVAYDNGRSSAPAALEGPEGIWTYDSTRMILERNIAYGNHTGSQVDGGGFDLDNNVSYSLVQYNLSYGNDGAGFLAFSAASNSAHTNNAIRYNISQNNSRKLQDYGGIVVFGSRITNLAIYQNTVLAATEGSVRAPALRLQPSLGAVSVRNNVFLTDGSPVVAAHKYFDTSEVVMQGNDYHSPTGFNLQWGERWYTDLSAWRSESRQEMAGSRATGTGDDPCLVEVPLPTSGSDVRDSGPTRGALASRCAPALAGAVVDLKALGIDPGPVDYLGTPLTGSPGAGAVPAAPRA